MRVQETEFDFRIAPELHAKYDELRGELMTDANACHFTTLLLVCLTFTLNTNSSNYHVDRLYNLENI